MLGVAIEGEFHGSSCSARVSLDGGPGGDRASHGVPSCYGVRRWTGACGRSIGPGVHRTG
ncbi:hypothetical protein ppKF707_2469 [Metapseudomonas furukawaii]|nr:hypothetical protein ppKF707_2469 [Pseudomonas furukawaii]